MPRNIDFNLKIDDSLNEIFDENVGNSFLAIRRLRWRTDGEYKVDLRKWYTTSEGEEVAGKGFSFLTEDGPNELTKVLLKHGYGNTEDVLDQLSEREDFSSSLTRVINRKGIKFDGIPFSSENDDSSNQKFYDPKELLK